MIIDTVQEALREGSLVNNPALCAEYRAQMSGEMSYLISQLGEIKTKKPELWLEMRKSHNSDSATNKAYDATELGVLEVQLRGKVKQCEKLMQGLNSIIKLAEAESRNQY